MSTNEFNVIWVLVVSTELIKTGDPPSPNSGHNMFS